MSIRVFEDLDHAEDYASYRPVYSVEVTHKILDYLWKQLPADESGRLPLAVDVGCGPGHQTTVPLAEYFDKVLGTDVSPAQIDVALKSDHPSNIEFRTSKAESLPLPNESVQLVQAGTSLHWFDAEEFYKECDRVLVPGGVIAAFSYQPVACQVADTHPNAENINKIMEEILTLAREKGYFLPAQYIVDRRYTDAHLLIPYKNRERVDDLTLTVESTLAGFLGYYRSFTSFRTMAAGEPEATREWFIDVVDRLMKACGTDSLEIPFTYHIPLFILLGRKPTG